MAKLYPIDIQNFESLREDGYIYVDKTELIYQLVKTGRYYLLNRLRRFGESLFISTLEAYLLGKKELFKNLVWCDEEYGQGYQVCFFDRCNQVRESKCVQ